MNKYEVYVCRFKGEIVYIGQGAIGRNYHCLSGTSHVYELNKIHFSDEKDLVKVEVVAYFETKTEALKHESNLIADNKPKYNKIMVISDRQDKSNRRNKFRRVFLDNIVGVHKGLNSKDSLVKAFDEFFDFHKDYMLEKEGILLRTESVYKNAGLVQLTRFSRQLRTNKDCQLTTNTYYKFFKILNKTYKEVYKLDFEISFIIDDQSGVKINWLNDD